MRVSSIRRIIRTLLLSVAYIACMMQWLWIMIIAIPPLIESGTFDGLISSSRPAEPAIQSQGMEMNPLTWSVVAIVTVLMIMLTIAVILRLPAVVVKTGDKAVQKATDSVIPVIVHHQPIPAKKRKALSRRIRLSLQLVVSGLPLIISLFLPAFEDITRQIILVVSLYLAVASALMFVLAWSLEGTTSRTRSRASRG